jgi:hypothetical protein
LRNLANQRRFDAAATFDELAARSGLARSTVVDLLTGDSPATKLGSWHALAQALDLPLPTLVAALDDPDWDQPNVIPPAKRGPSLTQLVRQVLAAATPEQAARFTTGDLHRIITDMGHTVTPDAVRLAKWRVDKSGTADSPASRPESDTMANTRTEPEHKLRRTGQ